MSEILNINGNVQSDSSIISIQEHIYNPYNSSFGYNDEIRIPIQQQDLLLLISDSTLQLEIELNNVGQDAAAALENFFIGFLFDEIRYEMNGVEVDRSKNSAITTLMKNYTSLSKSNTAVYYSSTFRNIGVTSANPNRQCYQIPLRMLLGFAEDYRKVIMNAKHELILVRSRSNLNCLHGVEENLNIEIKKVQWKVPHVSVSDRSKLMLIKHIEKRHSIPMTFRSWDLYEYPSLPTADKHVWSVKTTNHLNKPRYVIVGFQSNRKNDIGSHASFFDHINIRDISLCLNNERYPYEKMDLDFAHQYYTTAYSMYTSFQSSYYSYHARDVSPYASYEEFLQIPLFVFDCSRQNEAIKSSMVDIRLEIASRQNFPANTSAYCLVIHDNIITYNPYNNIVTRAI